MKSPTPLSPLLLSAFSIVFVFALAASLRAQGVQVQVQPVPAPATVVEEVRPTVEVIDPVIVRRQLSIEPRVVVVPKAPPPVLTKVPAPSPDAIEAFNNRPRRVYNAERNVVTVEEKEQSRELPYVTLPVLFVKETAQLLDAESRENLEKVAAVILEISKTTPGAKFEIEGHTSTDGADDFNLKLSVDRAQRVYDELTQRYGVPPAVLTSHGYGENYPMHPNGTEAQMQLDRRVLVVRAR
jgi:outer membrane protein OmpA-like peptidoglycan-associated protein